MDQREMLLKDLSAYLQTAGIEDVSRLSDGMVKILAGYEVTKCSTEIAVRDGENEKLLKRYSACLRLDGKSEKTIYQYIRTCKKLFEMIGKPFVQMGAYDVRFFLAMEKERGISNRSLENSRAYLSAFYQWLTNEELIGKNPILKISTIKYPEEIRLPFSDVEVDALRSACQTLKERAIVELLLSTGIRVSELTKMRTRDIDFQSLEVHVVEGKGGNGRKTFTTAVSAKHLMDYIKSKNDTEGEFLFYNFRHDPLTPGGVRYILAELGKRAGVDNVHPHRFRRTFATSLATRGMDIQDIQALLGHKSLDTTMTYVHMSDTKIQAAYKHYIV